MRAALEESFYNVTVTSAEMWQAVGKRLEHARHERKWRPADVERAGGPSYKTVQAIENGHAGNVRQLERCARALGLDLVDVLYEVLTSRETPLSAEAAHVVRSFDATTVEGRTALVALANALPRSTAPAAPAAPRQSRPAPPAVTHRKPR